MQIRQVDAMDWADWAMGGRMWFVVCFSAFQFSDFCGGAGPLRQRRSDARRSETNCKICTRASGGNIERESGNSMSSAKEREILERQRRIASSFGGTSSSRGTGAAASSSTNWRRQDTRSTCSTNSIVCTRASQSFLDASSTAESSSMVPMSRIHSTVCLSAD